MSIHAYQHRVEEIFKQPQEGSPADLSHREPKDNTVAENIQSSIIPPLTNQHLLFFIYVFSTHLHKPPHPSKLKIYSSNPKKP